MCKTAIFKVTSYHGIIHVSGQTTCACQNTYLLAPVPSPLLVLVQKRLLWGYLRTKCILIALVEGTIRTKQQNVVVYMDTHALALSALVAATNYWTVTLYLHPVAVEGRYV